MCEDDLLEKGILRNGKAFSGIFERIFQKVRTYMYVGDIQQTDG